MCDFYMDIVAKKKSNQNLKMKSRGLDIGYIAKSLSLKTIKLFLGLNMGLIKQVVMNKNITQGMLSMCMLGIFRVSQLAILSTPAVRVGILLLPFVVRPLNLGTHSARETSCSVG